MKTNAAGIALIKSFESCHLKAYRCPAGKWTIGWGATFYEDGQRVQPGETITRERADQLLEFHLQQFERDVASLVTSAVNDNQFSALVSFAYNLGSDIDADKIPEGLGDSTLLKKVNANPNDPAIRTEFLKWISRGTAYEKGLRRRRTAEANLYFKPVS